MEFRILGPLEVVEGGEPIEIAGSKRRAVLALLLLHANEVVRSERLIDDLWGDRAPSNAQAALHNHVSRLRKSLGADAIARREWGYVLRVPAESIDLRRFEQIVSSAEPLPARERAAKLAEALMLWRGPALTDLAGEPGLRAEIARLDELHLTMIERRIDADLEAGRNSELVGEIESLIAAHPLREHLRWQLILALYRAGRQAEALEVYRETRRVLTEELGLEPSPALKELERAILRQDPALATTVSSASPASTQPAGGMARRKRRWLLATLLSLLALAVAGVIAAFALTASTSSPGAIEEGQAAIVSTHQPTRQQSTSKQDRRGARTKLAKRTRAQRRVVHVVVVTTHIDRTVSESATRQVLTTQVTTGLVTTRTRQTRTRTGTHTARQTTTRQTRTTTTTTTTTAPSKFFTISDNFGGSSLDGTIWYEICCDGTGATLAQQNGALEFSFVPGTVTGGPYNVAGGHVGTQCKFPGDFDARVDFTLVRWPPANGVIASLWAFFGPTNIGAQVNRGSTAAWGEQYNAWLGSRFAVGVKLADASGTLRLARKNGVLTAYFLHNGGWQKLLSRSYGTLLATVALGASVGAGTGTSFAGQQVVVDFDNFTVTGADPICPAGSQPPGS